MTINQAIMQVNELLENNISEDIKVKWLSDLDYGIFIDVILTHEVTEEVNFTPYDADTDRDTELLVPAPYDGMYPAYLKMKINSELYEYARYNANRDEFNAILADFKAYYNRNYRPSKYNNMKYWG